MANLNFDAVVFARAIEGFGKTVTRTPVTKTLTSFSGDEILTEGTSENIECAFFVSKDKYIQDKPGLIQDADAVIIVYPAQTLNKNDKFTYDSENYRVMDDIFERRLGGTLMYKYARLKLI